jgi:hypothetical protein
MALQKYAIVDTNTNLVINVIQYENQPNNPPPGFSPETIAVQSDTAGPGWTYVNGQFTPPSSPAPTPDELLAACKRQAMSLLSATDWVEIPSVTDPAINPHLTNANDFITYRAALRQLAVTPVTDPVWPTKPTEQWSS